MIGGIGGLKGLNPRKRSGSPASLSFLSSIAGNGLSVSDFWVGDPSPDRLIVVSVLCNVYPSTETVSDILINGQSSSLWQISAIDVGNGLRQVSAFGLARVPAGKKVSVSVKFSSTGAPYPVPGMPALMQIYRLYGFGLPVVQMFGPVASNSLSLPASPARAALVTALRIAVMGATLSASNVRVDGEAVYNNRARAVEGQVIDCAVPQNFVIGDAAAVDLSAMRLVWR